MQSPARIVSDANKNLNLAKEERSWIELIKPHMNVMAEIKEAC